MSLPKLSSCCFRVALAALAIAPILHAAAPPAKELPSDTCSLLPERQLQEIFDQSFGRPQRSTAPAAHPGQSVGTECEYTTQSGLARKVIFIVYVDPSAAKAKETFEKLSIWFAPKSQLAGIADSAYIDENHAIHIVKSKIRYYINIIPIGTITPEKEKQLRDLAAFVSAQI